VTAKSYSLIIRLVLLKQVELVTISIEGKITDMNEATVKITGVERELLTGSDF
jgi:PAS domain-containing protein